MIVGDHRIAQGVVLVIIFDDRPRQLGAFLDPEALGQRSRGDVAHHNFDGDDLDLPDQLLAHVQAADEVRRHADRRERREDVLRNAVVDHALAADRPAFLRVERSRIVLEILDQGAGLGTLVKDLGLALIDLAAASHWRSVTPTRTGRSGGYKRGARCVLVRAPHRRLSCTGRVWMLRSRAPDIRFC